MIDTLELSQDELAFIVAQRTATRAFEINKAEADAYIMDASITALLKRKYSVAAMKEKLVLAGGHSVLEYDAAGYLGFFIGQVFYQVQIKEHTKSTPYSFRNTSLGYKYLLCEGFNSYRNQWYSSPKTYLARVATLQAAYAATVKSNAAARTVKDIALAAMTAKYPTATVAFEKGYDYRASGARARYTSNNYKPDIINVSTVNGSYCFTYGVAWKGNDVAFYMYTRTFNGKLEAQLQELVLGPAVSN